MKFFKEYSNEDLIKIRDSHREIAREHFGIAYDIDEELKQRAIHTRLFTEHYETWEYSYDNYEKEEPAEIHCDILESSIPLDFDYIKKSQLPGDGNKELSELIQEKFSDCFSFHKYLFDKLYIKDYTWNEWVNWTHIGGLIKVHFYGNGHAGIQFIKIEED